MDLSAFNLQGKVALITGGAHGIGFSIAEGWPSAVQPSASTALPKQALKRALQHTRQSASTHTAMWPTCPMRTL